MLMESVLQWAKEWQALVTLVGTILLFFYVVETYRIRLAAITSGAPSVRLIIADAQTRPRLRVLNIEGRVAYNVSLDGFVGTLTTLDDDDRPVRLAVRCSFEPIPHLRPSEHPDLDVQIESPDGTQTFDGDSLFGVLRSATGRGTGLPLRLRYQDGMGMKYVVKVEMPNRIYHDFMGVIDVQPSCSPPIPMTTLARVENRIIWPVMRAVKHRRIRREVTARPRRPRRAAVAPAPTHSEESGSEDAPE